MYPSTLFHFTKQKTALFGILVGNFKISYAREAIVGSKERRVFHAPMVSFCDLRLAELIAHMGSYGEYGIGMSKKWATEKGLNPVAYWSSQARLIDNILKKLEHDYRDIMEEFDEVKSKKKQEHYDDLIDIVRFIKNYEGRLERRDGEVVDPYRFADEREWRYVPKNEWVFPPFLSENADKHKWNQSINEQLKFEPDDIRYIIVSNERERLEVINHIKYGTGKAKKYGDEAVIRLSSRILTAEQIRDDV